MSDHLERDVIIYLYANGAMVYREARAVEWKGPLDAEKNPVEGALPVYSVDTTEEAEELQTMLCRLSRADNETMILPFSQKVEDLEHVTTMLDRTYQAMKEGKRKMELWGPFVEYKQIVGVL